MYFFLSVFRKGGRSVGSCIYPFFFMVSFYYKFTESFDIILVNCNDVYLDY